MGEQPGEYAARYAYDGPEMANAWLQGKRAALPPTYDRDVPGLHDDRVPVYDLAAVRDLCRFVAEHCTGDMFAVGHERLQAEAIRVLKMLEDKP